jgi:hypothetical protein
MPAGADAEAGPPPACVQPGPGPGGRPRQGIRHDGQQIFVFLYALIFSASVSVVQLLYVLHYFLVLNFVSGSVVVPSRGAEIPSWSRSRNFELWLRLLSIYHRPE